MKLAKAQASIYDIQKQLNSIIIQLKDYISSLPDNPNIQRKNNKCFIMNSKHLQNNWSVLYYDYRHDAPNSYITDFFHNNVRSDAFIINNHCVINNINYQIIIQIYPKNLIASLSSTI